MSGDLWILGAAGRTGSGVARNLAKRGLKLVLVGRDEGRLQALARELTTESKIVVAKTLEETLEALRKSAPVPSVVVNTIGPFAQTAPAVIRACPKGTHYVDLSNELLAVVELLAMNDEAAAAGKCLVTGAGYGFVGTECVVRRLCEGRPAPARVRVDAVPFIGGGGVALGEALAASIVDSLAAGGREYRDGQLVPARPASHPEKLTLPDGSNVVTATGPTGDLVAAWRASKAPSVVAGSSELPSGAIARMVIPMMSALMRWKPMRDFSVRQFAQVKAPAATHGRTSSFGHARVEWSDGTRREGWLRAGEGMDYTCAVLAEVSARLASGGARPGAFTPCELFGAELAEAAGAQISIIP